MGTKPSPGSIVVVDDNASARRSVAEALTACGHTTTVCTSGAEALAALGRDQFDLVITDLQMPGMSGLELIREIHRLQIPVATLMVTAHATIPTAVEAMRHGASDYLEKPFNLDSLESAVCRALQRRLALDATEHQGTSSPLLLGESPSMAKLRQQLAKIAPTDAAVLITGESGTGKELVARTIHQLSDRSHGPFVGLNCPVLSAQLLESELFGHIKGAFTGADADRQGRFELAATGTLLLDEVTEIDLTLQPKLLRVLQEQTFERVGSSESMVADVRIIATSNRNLPEEIRAGNFREDLFYRLAVLPVEVPPLRDRGEDVLVLAKHFLQASNERLGGAPQTLSEQAQQRLLSYHWPGNVRELQNLITRASVMASGSVIDGDDLAEWLGELPDAPATIPLGKTLDEMERELITATLERFEGHRGKTATALGIAVRTLSGKLRAYGLAPHEKTFSKSA